MANRQFDQYDLTIQKRVCTLFAQVAVPAGTTPVLQKYNYPVQGVGGRTLSAAATASAPLGFPQNYQSGCDGVFSVARTGTGLWTVTLQDNYQRLMTMGGSMSIAGGLANIISVGENTTITNLASANGSIIGVSLLSAGSGSAAPALADPTAGASTVIRLWFKLGDATEP